LWLLFGLALRRGEVVALDLEDLNIEEGFLKVMGKGRAHKEVLSLPPKVKAALASWLEVRGMEQGPLFTNFDRRGGRKRLTGTGLYKMIQELGAGAGMTVRPHGLRHAAITRALDLTNGDVRSVQKFSRHRNIQTVVLYDDSRRDMGGAVARLVAGE
jgi:integrase/recombinase XerC